MSEGSRSEASRATTTGASAAPVQSVKRAVDLLEAVAAHDGSASLAELSRATGLHKTTAWRLLATLRDAGLVRHVPGEERYSLGSRALALGDRARVQLLPVPVVRGVLVRLRDRTNETCHLAVPEGPGLVYVEKVESNQTVRIASSVGARLPLHCTALGKAYLAFQRDDVLADRLSVLDLTRRTDRTVTDRARLQRELERVRANGFALDDRENELQTRCVGAPIVNADGIAVAAISVSAPVARFSLAAARAIGPVVQDAADELGAAMASSRSGSRAVRR